MKNILLLFGFFFTHNAHSLERPPVGVQNSFALLGVEKTLAIVSKELQKNNGTMLDERTKQLNSTANGRNFNLALQVQLRKKDTDVVELKKAAEAKVIPMTCTAPINVMIITDMGALYTIHYYDIGYEFLFSISIDKNSCKKY